MSISEKQVLLSKDSMIEEINVKFSTLKRLEIQSGIKKSTMVLVSCIAMAIFFGAVVGIHIPYLSSIIPAHVPISIKVAAGFGMALSFVIPAVYIPVCINNVKNNLKHIEQSRNYRISDRVSRIRRGEAALKGEQDLEAAQIREGERCLQYFRTVPADPDERRLNASFTRLPDTNPLRHRISGVQRVTEYLAGLPEDGRYDQ